MVNFLVIGLGSMGKRRVRCLKALGHSEIYGFDPRADRTEEALKLGIKLVQGVEDFLASKKPVCIISVPPDVHHEYMQLCFKHGCHFFVEASVCLDGIEELWAKYKNSSVVAAPSCTLAFHPGIQFIFKLLKEDRIGKLSNMVYHSGQYLPDWHPYE